MRGQTRGPSSLWEHVHHPVGSRQKRQQSRLVHTGRFCPSKAVFCPDGQTVTHTVLVSNKERGVCARPRPPSSLPSPLGKHLPNWRRPFGPVCTPEATSAISDRQNFPFANSTSAQVAQVGPGWPRLAKAVLQKQPHVELKSPVKLICLSKFNPGPCFGKIACNICLFLHFPQHRFCSSCFFIHFCDVRCAFNSFRGVLSLGWTLLNLFQLLHLLCSLPACWYCRKEVAASDSDQNNKKKNNTS